jgi:predicted metal-dependent HD superfamily phosphohydrolase
MAMATSTQPAAARVRARSAPSSAYNCQASSPQATAIPNSGQAARTRLRSITIAAMMAAIPAMIGARNHHITPRTCHDRCDSTLVSTAPAIRMATAG